MILVDYAWLVPGLVLAALTLELLIYMVMRFFRSSPQGLAGGGESDEESAQLAGHHESHSAQGDHALDTSAHADHGGPTPLWARVCSWIGIAALLGAFAFTIALLIEFIQNPAVGPGGTRLLQAGRFIPLYNWFDIGNLVYAINFRVDSLTFIMLVVVTSVSMLVHIYSLATWQAIPAMARFFTELALFTVSMLILVLAANFLVIFIGWELVGLSSYLLIGFWFYHSPPPPGSEEPYPPPAQLKAFVTTRLGDFGFMIGILILFVQTSTFDFVQLNTATLHADKTAVTVAMILVFCGAVGKSAQFPLHVWLPDAMAGPTPVSALIHAATMVAAGVYLVARLFPIYAAAAGPQALAGRRLRRRLHRALCRDHRPDAERHQRRSGLFDHQPAWVYVCRPRRGPNQRHWHVPPVHPRLLQGAALPGLWLCDPWSVSAQSARDQDMRKMGGLARFMPITALCFLVANLSISGIPPFSGFWSKDPIIGTAAVRQGNYVIFGMTLFTAFLTAFYMFRLFFLTFGGKGGAIGGFWGGAAQYRGDAHPHESPLSMTGPIILLAGATIVIGRWASVGLNQGFAWFLNGGANVSFATMPTADLVTLAGVGTGVVGIALAWPMYGVEVVPARALVSNPIGGRHLPPALQQILPG